MSHRYNGTFCLTLWNFFCDNQINCNMIVIYSKCESVVLPRLGEQIKGKEEVFCPRCDCKYENRNTTIIKVFNSFLSTNFT